jgi:TrmH RNA methyltransferase
MSPPYKKKPDFKSKERAPTPKTSIAPKPKPSVSSEAARGKGQDDEIKLCGVNACQKLFLTRAEDIIRVYLTEERTQEFSELVKSCARRRKAYHVVTREDLDKISGSTHHEGICILAKRQPPPSWEKFLETLEQHPNDPILILILEEVSNPHNIGAITRSAAHFGCQYVVLPNEKNFKPSAALLRTAEGGGEHVEFISAPSISVISTELRLRHLSVFGTAMKGRISLYHAGEKGALPARLAVILGNEAKGLSLDARKAAAGLITIPGTGAVESLNVGISAALIAGEYFRQHSLKA